MDLNFGPLWSHWKHDTKPYNTILVVVNQYTTQVRYFPCKNSVDEICPAKILARKLYLPGAGVRWSIVSNCGPQCSLKSWAAFYYHLRINCRLSSAYHLQTEEQIELQNQTLKLYLCTYVNYLQNDWVYWLPLAECTYNESVHASTGIARYYAEKHFYPSIEAFIHTIPVEGSVLDVHYTKARADRLVELWAAIRRR